MNSQTLFRLGGAALLISTLFAAFNNVAYLLAPDAPFSPTLAWSLVFGEAFLLLGLFALFAQQAPRGGWLSLAGFVLLTFNALYTVAAVTLALAAGGEPSLSAAPSLALAAQVFPWTYYLGTLLFGLALYRDGGFTRYAGVLLALLGLRALAADLLSLFLPVPLFAVLSLVTWGWLGLALWRGRSTAAPAARPA